LRLLTQICKRVNLQIDIHERAVNGQAEHARPSRQLKCIEDQDRRVLDRLIDVLHQRLSPTHSDEVPHSLVGRCVRSGSQPRQATRQRVRVRRGADPTGM
jgi:hypothetical protein